MEIRGTSCCGMREFSGLGNPPENIMRTIAVDLFFAGSKWAFIIFSDPVGFGKGEALKKYINDNGLGVVTESVEMGNPNTERMLKIYIFAPDKKVLAKWYEVDKKRMEKEYGGFVPGAKVRALENDYYDITRNGWVGRVVRVEGECMRVEGDGLVGYATVLMKYFELIENAK